MTTDRTQPSGEVGDDDLARALFPSLPVQEVLDRYRRAAGNEIGSNKFVSRRSSAALAANTFGFFLHRPGDFPPFPQWSDKWNPLRVVPEEEVRFPWAGGHHPWLDAVIETDKFLIGVESKRYEPFDSHSRDDQAPFSEAYWRDKWGKAMHPYQWVRDGLAHRPDLFVYLNAAQLVKHAFGLRTQGKKLGKVPVLVYLHADPKAWPDSPGKTISEEVRAQHTEELRWFARMVAGAEVPFLHFTYGDLLGTFVSSHSQEVRDHAERLRERFAIA